MPPAPLDWAGMRTMSPDGLPYIGAVPGRDGLYVATGHATLGITLAPLSGELLAGLMLEDRHDALLDAFDPRRFAGRARRVQDNVRPRVRPAQTTGGAR
jgi:glycine/D-amino acid oxidase-like deaminating enzyme